MRKTGTGVEPFPVIHISYGQMVTTSNEVLEKLIYSILNEHAKNYEIDLSESLLERRFYELIVKLSRKFREKVVIFEVIESRGYGEKYLGKMKEIYLVGIDFSQENKNILRFEWEKVQ